MDRIRPRVVGAAAYFLENIFAQIALAIILVFGQISVGWYLVGANKHPLTVLIIQTIFWTILSLAFIFWFQDHRAHRARRTLELTKAMQLSDSTVAVWLSGDRGLSEKEAIDELRSAITVLLNRLCGILAYRVPHIEKGATFLVLLDNADDAAFGLFAHVHHDDPDIPKEIRTHLKRGFGIAGQAVREGACVMVHDCRRLPRNSQWAANKVPPRFVGRAVVPVRGTFNDQKVDIGALCFDVLQPWTLSEEDQELAQAFADKIAALCVLWIRIHTGDVGIQLLRKHALR